MMAEIFPGYASSAGASLGCAVNWGFTMIVSGTFPALQKALGDLVFLPYMTCALIALLYSIRFVPETKGRTIEEILAIINTGTTKTNSITPGDKSKFVSVN